MPITTYALLGHIDFKWRAGIISRRKTSDADGSKSLFIETERRLFIRSYRFDILRFRLLGTMTWLRLCLNLVSQCVYRFLD